MAFIMCYNSQPSSSSSFVVQFYTLSQVLDQWRSITSYRPVLNMTKDHHLQPRSHCPLFHNFKWSNIKAVAAPYPIIQREVDELLAVGTIEPPFHDADLYSNVFAVPKHNGVSGAYITLSGLIIMCTSLLLRCLLSDMYGNLLSGVIMLSPLNSRILIYIFLLSNIIIIIFYALFGKICHISGNFYILSWPQP